METEARGRARGRARTFPGKAIDYELSTLYQLPEDYQQRQL
jgi:hypothetical protein